MNAIIQIGMCRSLMSLKKLVLHSLSWLCNSSADCDIPLSSVFSLIRAIDQGCFPMLRELVILGRDCMGDASLEESYYEVKSKYMVSVDAHTCPLFSLERTFEFI